MKAVFLVHLLSTRFMTGVIWFAQAVHYPLLGRVGKEAFAAYEKENTRRTGWVAIPAMTAELTTASSPLEAAAGLFSLGRLVERGACRDMGFHLHPARALP